jgi:hypothetical protein
MNGAAVDTGINLQDLNKRRTRNETGREQSREWRPPMSRRLVVWEAHHDNGWTTSVREQLSGLFLLELHHDRTAGFTWEEQTLADAHLTAVAALERKTGHAKCSPGCSGWVLRLEQAPSQIESRDPDAGSPAPHAAKIGEGS